MMSRCRLPDYGEDDQDPPSGGGEYVGEAGGPGLAGHYMDCQKESWNERIHGLLNNQEMSDISFRVTDGSSFVIFKAHKFLLSLRSPVFHTMFYGSLKETRPEIEVPDVAPSAFRAMLVYLYRDVTSLQSLQTAWQLWYAAKKYMLYSLEASCRKYVESNMNPLNVLDTYAFAENYGDQHLVYQCLRLIDRHASHILASPTFPALPAGLVHNIVARHTLNASEIEVFEAMVRWAQAEIQRHLDCAEQVEVPSLTSVASQFLPHVKFSQISSLEFVHRVLPRGVLDIGDISRIATEIKVSETPPQSPVAASADPASPASPSRDITRALEVKLGLNQASDLLAESLPSPHPHDSQLSTIHRHSSYWRTLPRRLGPGHYECTRSTGNLDMKVLRQFPAQYRLTITVDRHIYLLGVCVSEADGHFLPKLNFKVKLEDQEGKVMSEGAEKVAKQFCNACNSPLDVSLKHPSYLLPQTKYHLILEISNYEDPWSVSPLLLPHCQDNVESFGVKFSFDADHSYCSITNRLVPKTGGNQAEKDSGDNIPFGLISRLYFFF